METQGRGRPWPFGYFGCRCHFCAFFWRNAITFRFLPNPKMLGRSKIVVQTAENGQDCPKMVGIAQGRGHDTEGIVRGLGPRG